MIHQIVHVNRMKPYISRHTPSEDVELDPFDTFNPNAEAALYTPDEEDVGASSKSAEAEFQEEEKEKSTSDVDTSVESTTTSDYIDPNLVASPVTTNPTTDTVAQKDTAKPTDNIDNRVAKIVGRRGDPTTGWEYLIEWVDNTSTWVLSEELKRSDSQIVEDLII